MSRVTPVHTAMRNCTRDEGRSFEVGNQVLISSHRMLLSSVRWPIACAVQHGVLQWVIFVRSTRFRRSRHVRFAPKATEALRTAANRRYGRVEDGRGSLGHAATLRFPSPLIGRVEDWRAGVGRSLCSLLSRPFVCECHTISTMPRFQPPPRRTQRADFLALRSPVCFASRLMGPILPERLSASVAEPGSR